MTTVRKDLGEERYERCMIASLIVNGGDIFRISFDITQVLAKNVDIIQQ